MTLLQHKFMRDVALRITSKTRDKEGNWECKVEWYNITNPIGAYPIGIDTIYITKESLKKDWKEIEVRG